VRGYARCVGRQFYFCGNLKVPVDSSELSGAGPLFPASFFRELSWSPPYGSQDAFHPNNTWESLDKSASRHFGTARRRLRFLQQLSSKESIFFDRRTFWYSSSTYFYLPQSARAYTFPQSVSTWYFCAAAALVLTPLVPFREPVAMLPVRTSSAEVSSQGYLEVSSVEAKSMAKAQSAMTDQMALMIPMLCYGDNNENESRMAPIADD